jgi:hypothetical protein
LRDIQQIAETFAPDVLFGEAATFGGLFYSELSGVPLAVLGVIPLARSSIDAAPFGLGLMPDASTLGRVRNRALNWAVRARAVSRRAAALERKRAGDSGCGPLAGG